jgi:hypothetical protein
MKRSAASNESPQSTSGLDVMAAAAASSSSAGEASDGQTSEEDAKRREREWLAPRTGRRSTRVGEDFQCKIPELGSEPLEPDDRSHGPGSTGNAGSAAAAEAQVSATTSSHGASLKGASEDEVKP